MALTEYQITDADVGRVLGVPDGYLVSLSRTVAPPVYEIPDGDVSRQVWKNAYLTLKGSGDFQPIYCNNPHQNGQTPMWVGDTMILVSNKSLRYRGDLVVVSVPRGSVHTLTLSDAPNPRQPSVGLGVTARKAAAMLAAARAPLPPPLRRRPGGFTPLWASRPQPPAAR